MSESEVRGQRVVLSRNPSTYPVLRVLRPATGGKDVDLCA